MAQAALTTLWAGAFTWFEISRYNPEIPMGEQGLILLPHLATLGFGVGAGGLFHVFRAPAILYNVGGQVAKFHYEWNDPKQLGLILGHHLIILGLGAFLLVFKAMIFGGIYDTNLGNVRLISNPNLNPVTIFGYLVGLKDGNWTPLGMASVDNLEDVIGGHIWIGLILIAGGTWHILVQPFAWVRRILPIENGEEILSYSLLGLALMAWISAAFVGYNTIVFPREFYGSERLGLADTQFFLGVVAFLGYVWHSWRSWRQVNF